MVNKHIKHVFAVAILMVASYSLPQVKNALAESTLDRGFICPQGYTCVPTVTQPVNCPVGFTCVPIQSANINQNNKKIVEPTNTAFTPVTNPIRECYTFGFDLDPQNLKNGVSPEKDSGVALLNLQNILEKNENIDINNIETGIAKPAFGNSTKEAVVKFQKAYGIPATGYVGPITRARLNKAYGCDVSGKVVTPSKILPTAADKIQPVTSQEKAQYYLNTKISNVSITKVSTNAVVKDNSTVNKGELYRISWQATDVPESARFTIAFQSPTNPSIYGVLKTGIIDSTKRSYDWTVSTGYLDNTDYVIRVEVGNTMAYSPVFRFVAPTTNSATTTSVTTQSTGTAEVKVKTQINSVYPSSGAPGTKVTVTLSNPLKYQLNIGDFAFGNYGLPGFMVINNETITFTVPKDAPTGFYDIVWFANDSGVYTKPFNVIGQSAPTTKATGWHYVASVFDSLLTIASFFM